MGHRLAVGSPPPSINACIMAPYTDFTEAPGTVRSMLTSRIRSQSAPAFRTYASSSSLLTRRNSRTRSEASTVSQKPSSAASTIFARWPVRP